MSSEEGASAAQEPPATEAVRSRPGSIEERRRLVAESLRVGNPGNRARELPEQADPRHDCQIELKVEDIRPYEHNPRRANNARFAEIKESIRQTGVRNPLTVTRRPGEKHFIVEAGGNTRLLALQQLWGETQDSRFEKLTALFRPWRSEVHVLSAHLIENESRGEMSFWDKANGVLALKAQLEEEKGRALSLRQLEEELKAIGFSVNTATLGLYVYAATRLRILGDGVAALSGLDVKTLQPRLNLMKRYAQMRGGTGEAALYAGIFEPVFRRYTERGRETQAFNVAELCQACEEALARHLGENVAQLRTVLDTLSQSPQASLEALLETAGSARSDRRADRPQGSTRGSDNTGSAVSSADTASTVRSATNAPGTITGRPIPRPSRSVPRVGPGTAVRERLISTVARFAELANLADCVQASDAAPLGYYMELPPMPFGGPPGKETDERAWWLLALMSGQCSQSMGERLPDRSGWRYLCEADGDAQKAMPLGVEFFDWLLDAKDEAAEAFWQIATLAREVRAASRERVAAAAPQANRARLG